MLFAIYFPAVIAPLYGQNEKHFYLERPLGLWGSLLEGLEGISLSDALFSSDKTAFKDIIGLLPP